MMDSRHRVLDIFENLHIRLYLLPGHKLRALHNPKRMRNLPRAFEPLHSKLLVGVREQPVHAHDRVVGRVGAVDGKVAA